MIVTHTEREREAETQAEGEAGSIHREPDMGLDPGSPGLRPGPKAGAKPLCHPGIPLAIELRHSNTFKFKNFKHTQKIIPHLSICLSCTSWDESFSLDEQVADTLSDTWHIHDHPGVCLYRF